MLVDIETGKRRSARMIRNDTPSGCCYRLVMAEGMFLASPTIMQPIGARLVYLGRTGPVSTVELEWITDQISAHYQRFDAVGLSTATVLVCSNAAVTPIADALRARWNPGSGCLSGRPTAYPLGR
ncbi:hypothetical protein [Mycobacterium uberis]|uniref:hypothetical protein n=1 Tax=Mycobacterium uberis TaxID=2162698 RepID=UPI000E303112|nr:hypothetical protein [Mycobacterium uberis]